MIQSATPTLEPGVYLNGDISDAEYFALPYASKSGLWKVHLMPDTIRTIEQAQAWLVFDKPTGDMRLGRAFDDAMAIGDSWRDGWSEYPINPKTGASYGANTAKVREFLAVHGENAIASDEFDRVEAWRSAVMEHPDAERLVSHPKAVHQAVVIWDDERTGQRCKGKIDLWTIRDGVSTHVDYKTWTKKRQHVPSEVAFSWEVEDRGYHIQAAHYLDGCESIDRLYGRKPQYREFSIIAVNKTPVVIPSTGEELYDVDVLDFKQHQLEGALRIRDELLEKWIQIVNGAWKPARRGPRPLRLSGHLENDYGSRPE